MQNRLPDFPLLQYRSLQQYFRYEIHDTTFVLLLKFLLFLQLLAEFLPMEKNRTSPSRTATLGCNSMASTILLAEKLDKKASTVQETNRKTLAVRVNRSLSEIFFMAAGNPPQFLSESGLFPVLLSAFCALPKDEPESNCSLDQHPHSKHGQSVPAG